MAFHETVVSRIEEKFKDKAFTLDFEHYAVCGSSTFISSLSWVGAGTYIGSCVSVFANCHVGMSTFIDDGVTIFQNTIIEDSVVLLRNTTIGDNCFVGSYSVVNGHVPDRVYIGKHVSLPSTYNVGIEVGSVIVNLQGKTKVFLPDEIIDNLDDILKCE